jgi:hypothetical protein
MPFSPAHCIGDLATIEKKCGNFQLADHILGTLKMSAAFVKFASHPEAGY